MKKNIFIVILAFLVAGLAGFIAYDNFVKPQTKNTVKETKKTETKEKSADERYKDYLENLSKSIEKKYAEPKDFDNQGLIDQSMYTQAIENVNYTVTINEKKELRISYGESEVINPTYKEYKIADKVLAYFRVHVGNGGMYNIFYITEEGKVFSVNVEQLPTDKPSEPKEVTGVKNIVLIKEGTTVSAGLPIYIDIDGNITIK